MITIAELASWRETHDRVRRDAVTRLPTGHGEFRAVGYEDLQTGAEHIALVSPLGLRGRNGSVPIVRVHSECLTGDVFGSQRCDCGPQLEQSLDAVARRGGAVVYLRGHEGRGVGLLAKLQAYHLQDQGLDTVDAQTELGLPVDDREYGAAAAILYDLGVTRLELMTNNPDKVRALRTAGIEVTGIAPSWTVPTPDNEFYLRTKRDRMGHHILLDGVPHSLATPQEV
ncbi:Riboflavin biosynthesis protein RibBA [bioreactor metagenome]|uniref:GTP cyclohydrolase II n=1 Tax=bioreactor metagenome TaxID=1076179 RepID=A0A645D396_9ZZZZ